MGAATVRVLVLAGLFPAACGPGSDPARPDRTDEPFRVLRTTPADALRPGGRPVLLNERLTLYFSHPIDPLSVHGGSVRVVDEVGDTVRGDLQLGRYSVEFVPEPPLEPALDDGSFAPSSRYSLVVTGFPSVSSVVSAAGRRLTEGVRLPFHTVGREPPAGFPSPLLPVALGDEPFTVVPTGRGPRVPAASGRLRLSFSLPPLPSTARPEAFDVRLLKTTGDAVSLPIAEMRLLSRPRPVDPHPGCTLEIRLAPEPRLQAGDRVYLSVDPDRPLRDYGGRELLIPGDLLSWEVVPGDRIVLARWPRPGAPGPERYPAAEPLAPGFEGRAGGGIRPQLRAGLGDGRSGDFAPSSDTVLRPGGDRTDGEGRFAFRSFHVPDGVTVRVEAGQTVPILVLGSVRIDGTLELATPLVGHGLRTGQAATVRDLSTSGCSILAGGDLTVTGAIRHPDADGCGPRRAAVVLAAAGSVGLRGEVPPYTVIAGDLHPSSNAEHPVRLGAELVPEVPAGFTGRVEGWTPWRRLPPDIVQALEVRALGVDGTVTVAAQVAPADPVTGGPPRPPAALPQPRPVEGVLELPPAPGSYLRFRLRAQVRDGQPLPVIEALQLRIR